MNRLLQALMHRTIKRGSLTVIDADGTQTKFGDGSGPALQIKFHDAMVGRAILRGPELMLGETFMDGRWSVSEGELVDVLYLMMSNTVGMPTPRWRQLIHSVQRRLEQHNTARAARRNVKHHYDVGNDIYALFLDADWQYSCAYFAEPSFSLEEAQLAKKRLVASKMMLEPGQKVLDIGCGWGGLALYLADNAGVEVTGITLSDEQASRARARVNGHNGVRIEVMDYRKIDGPFDRLVSVGMFEHVGVGFYDTYFQHVRRLLADDGVMLLHSIGRVGVPGITNPFIARHIFPGGYVPALSEVLPAIERAGLVATDIEILRIHYAETLKEWRLRFMAAREKAAELKDERFVRMWEFYLAGCEASFRAGDMMVFQIQLAKAIDTVPLTRGYIAEAEAALAAQDSGAPAAPSLVANRS